MTGTGRRTRLRAAVAAGVLCGAFGVVAPGTAGARTIAYRTTAADPSQVVRNGGQLFLNGRPYTPVGVNAPQLTTMWSINWGCGQEVASVDSFFSKLAPGNVVTIWATQHLATNNKGTQPYPLDFRPIDRAITAAQRYGVKVIVSLAHQSGVCDDGHWKDRAWYSGGYKKRFDDYGFGTSPLSWWDYVHRIVPRYAGNTTVLGWVPVVEPEASNCSPGLTGADCYGRGVCPPDATAVLRRFYDVAGAEIKRLAPKQLVVSGTLGGGECGVSGVGYSTLHASPGIDVCDYHDYGSPAVPLPGGMRDRALQCNALNKPLLLGEVGIPAGVGGLCATPELRRDQFAAKLAAGRAVGVDGLVAWQWDLVRRECDLQITSDDPTMAWLRAQAPTERLSIAARSLLR